MKGCGVFALVRHAHAGDRKEWHGPDARRPLTRRGRQQAEGVAENLRAMPATQLLSSPALRCTQTLVPLSLRHGLQVATSELLGADADVAELDRMLDDPRLEGAVLCTHGETLNALFDRWRGRGVLRTSADDPESGREGTQKGAAWIVETEGGARTVHYLAPLHIGPVLLDA